MENLSAAHAEVKADARTDNKTGLLLAFVGAVLGVLGALIARFLHRTHPASTPAERLEIGPDNGDLMEWMGERFIWEPGDLDEPGEGER